MRRYALSLMISVICSPALAQVSMGEDCRYLIGQGLREFNVESDSYSNVNYIFDKYCDDQGQFNSKSSSVGLDAVVDSLLIKFRSGSSSSDQKIRNFCRDFKTETVSKRDSYRSADTTVRRAYESFDLCETLASGSVHALHKYESVDRVNFSMYSGQFRPIQIYSVDTSPNIACFGPDPSTEDHKSVAIDRNFHANIPVSQVFGFVCTRQGTKTDTGDIVYDEANVTVIGNLQTGNYNIYFPPETKISPNKASDIEKSLDKIRLEMDAHDKNAQSADRAIRSDVND